MNLIKMTLIQNEISSMNCDKVIADINNQSYDSIYGLIIHSQIIKLALLKCYALLNKNDFVIVCNSKPVIKYESAICHFSDPSPHSQIFKKVHISFNESTLIKLLFLFLFLLCVWYEWSKVTCVCLLTFYEIIKGQYNTFTIRLLCTNGSMSKAITINSHGLIKVK